jgi:hypothetical protein
MVLETSTATAGRTNPNATTESTEVSKIRLGIETALEGRGSIIFAGESIFDSKVSMECIWPEFDIKVGAVKHSLKSIAYRLMGAFHWSILVRTASASDADFVAKAFEKRADLGVVVKFSALVKHDILASNARRMSEKPVLEPGQRGSFGYTGSAIELRCGIICNEDVAGFAVDTFVGVSTSCIFGSLACKGEIDGQTLPWNGSRASRGRTTGTLRDLGFDAGRALVEYGILV